LTGPNLNLFHTHGKGKTRLTSIVAGAQQQTCFTYLLSVLEPVDVPQCWQRYSYKFPVGSTSRSRSRVGVAAWQEGQ